MTLVDTPVWSIVLRRKRHAATALEQRITQSLEELIHQGAAQIAGPIRQELLSGIRHQNQFDELRDYLRAFREPIIEVQDYEEAAQMNNQCRSRGIAGSGVDFLICAISWRRKWRVFTTDRDFERYAKVLPIQLHGAL